MGASRFREAARPPGALRSDGAFLAGLVLLGATVGGSAASAEAPSSTDEPTPPRVDLRHLGPQEGFTGQLLGRAGLDRTGEDLHAELLAGGILAGERWALAPRLPIRLRIADRSPQDDAVLRREDWDEPSDFGRLLPYARWGHLGDPVHVRLGELNRVRLGHGTLVAGYTSHVDVDHYQGGLYASVDQGPAGGELLLDNVIRPEILVGRPFVQPFRGLGELPLGLDGLRVGATAGADFRAPVALRTRDGEPVVGAHRGPVVERRDAVSLLGLDLEWPILDRDAVALMPYADLNAVDLGGPGVHAGAVLNVRFDPLTTWRMRLEYRRAWPGYEPDWLDAFYEIHRASYRGGAPKLAWLRGEGAAGDRHGFLLATDVHVVGRMRYHLLVSDEQGPGNTDLVLRLELPQIGPARVSAFFARLAFDGLDDLFEPGRMVAGLKARYNLGRFYVHARVTDEWWFRHTDAATSRFETTIGFDVGVGVLWQP